MKPIRSRAFAAAVVAVVVAGCATPRQVAKEIVDSNRAQEMAENQLLLLNILRAMHREPMHFTLVTAVHMPVGTGTPNVSLAVPFGNNAGPLTATAGTTVSQSVDITALNTQEFMRGITQPLPLDTMVYYIGQGWPREMILTLFVRTIDVPGGVEAADRTASAPAAARAADAARVAALSKRRYESYPGNPDQYKQFKRVVHHLAACDLSVDSDDPKHFGPALDAHQLTNVKALSQMRAASMVFAASSPTGQFQLATPSKGSHLTLGELVVIEDPGKPDEPKPVCPWEGGSAGPGTDAAADAKPVLAMSLRSPEAMIYFLGELVREQLEPGAKSSSGDLDLRYAKNDPRRGDAGETYPIFTVTHDVGPDACYVEVDFEDAHYCVPKYKYDNRSTHMLSLMHQLITLQNKGTDLPTTSTVRVVP